MRRSNLFGALLGCAILCGAPALAQNILGDPAEPSGDVVVLRGLDKIGARVTELEVPIGGSVDYGNLVITARYCRSSPPTEPPETKAFLEIDEVPPGEEARRIFSGWMFASTPAVSALEHPVYDVWVLSCRTNSGAASAASE
jgi:hypothetical protein